MSEVITLREIATLIADCSHVTKEINGIHILPWPYLREYGTDNCNCVGEWSYFMYVFTRATSTPVAERCILSDSTYNCHTSVLRPNSRLTSQKESFQERLVSRTGKRVRSKLLIQYIHNICCHHLDCHELFGTGLAICFVINFTIHIFLPIIFASMVPNLFAL
jgi:hypothetical protein